MNKLGRPRLNPIECRTAPVRIYLNDEENARLRREAHTHGLTVSAYVRHLLFQSVNDNPELSHAPFADRTERPRTPDARIAHAGRPSLAAGHP